MSGTPTTQCYAQSTEYQFNGLPYADLSEILVASSSYRAFNSWCKGLILCRCMCTGLVTSQWGCLNSIYCLGYRGFKLVVP